jgi:hypothetical protein
LQDKQDSQDEKILVIQFIPKILILTIIPKLFAVKRRYFAVKGKMRLALSTGRTARIAQNALRLALIHSSNSPPD